MCRSDQWWICSYAELINGGYALVQSLSMVDMLMCRAGQWWICACAVMVNGGYTHWQWWICSCVELVNGG